MLVLGDALALVRSAPPRALGQLDPASLGGVILGLAGLAWLPAAALVLSLGWIHWLLRPRAAAAGDHPDAARPRPALHARWLAAGLVLPWLGWGWLLLGDQLLGTVHDTRLGAAAWAGGAAVLLGLAWAVARTLAALLRAALPDRWLASAWVRRAALLLPLLGAWLLVERWVGRTRLAWGPLALAVLLLAAGPLGRRAQGRPGAARLRLARALAGRRGTALVAGAAGLALAAVFVAGPRGEVRHLLAAHSLLAGRTATALRVATDLDRDGHGTVFGGADCAPLDPRRHPGAREVPGNRRDEDCRGLDRLPAPLAPPAWLADHPLVEPDGWSFLLIVLDAVRADHVSWLGYPRQTTPRLAALAERCVAFPHAYSPSATTRYSIPALLAGRSPSALAWRRSGRNLLLAPGENLLLQQRLSRAGLFTAAVTSNYDIFQRRFGLAAGFSRYDTETVRFRSERDIVGRSGRDVTDAGLRLLAEAGARPFFLYLHYMDPHSPFEDPGGPTFGEREIDRYDAEIRSVDAEVGRLLDELARRPAARRLAVVVTADHGEQFGERGRTGHGRFVHDEEVHVPLLLCLPEVAPARPELAVSLLDLAPTLANLAGVQQGWDRLEGRNLLPLLQPVPTGRAANLAGLPLRADAAAGRSAPAAGGVAAPEASARLAAEQLQRPVFVETWPFSSYSSRRVAALRWPHKLLFSVTDQFWEAYDLAGDPRESQNLAARRPPARMAPLQESLVDWLATHPLP